MRPCLEEASLFVVGLDGWEFRTHQRWVWARWKVAQAHQQHPSPPPVHTLVALLWHLVCHGTGARAEQQALINRSKWCS